MEEKEKVTAVEPEEEKVVTENKTEPEVKEEAVQDQVSEDVQEAPESEQEQGDEHKATAEEECHAEDPAPEEAEKELDDKSHRLFMISWCILVALCLYLIFCLYSNIRSIDSLSHQMTAYQNDLNNTRAVYQTLYQEDEERKADLMMKDGEYDALKAQYDELQKGYEALYADYNDLLEQQSSDKDAHGRLQDRIRRLSNELDEIIKEFDPEEFAEDAEEIPNKYEPIYVDLNQDDLERIMMLPLGDPAQTWLYR